jgi:hypothetical protein
MNTLQYSTSQNTELNTLRCNLWAASDAISRTNKGLSALTKGQAFKGYNHALTALRHYTLKLQGKPIPERFTADFEITVCGIPCGVVVTDYSAPRDNMRGHPDNWLPDDPEEVEFFLIDRKGYPADWLYEKGDHYEMEREILEMISNG